MSKFKSFIGSIQADAENQYRGLFNKHLFELTLNQTFKGNKLKMLDVGCSDGSSTLRLLGNAKNVEIHGLDVGALFMGWQPFPMTNFTEQDAAIGNPFAFHCGEEVADASMLHTRLYTLKALKDLLRLHKFKVIEASGTGYYPLPTKLARTISKLDPAHAAFQYIKAQK